MYGKELIIVSELEWYRQNAPEALKSLSDKGLVAQRFMIFAAKVKSPYEPFVWDNKRGVFS